MFAKDKKTKTIETSPRENSKILSIKNLNSNILGYIKSKGLKYHNYNLPNSNEKKKKTIYKSYQTLSKRKKRKKEKEENAFSEERKNEKSKTNKGNKFSNSIYNNIVDNKSKNNNKVNETNSPNEKIQNKRNEENNFSLKNNKINDLETESEIENKSTATNKNKKTRNKNISTDEINKNLFPEKKEEEEENQKNKKTILKKIYDKDKKEIPLNEQFENLLYKIFYFLLKEDKEIFLRKIKEKSNFEEIKKNINNDKPKKKRRRNDSNNSLNDINNCLPKEEILPVKNNIKQNSEEEENNNKNFSKIETQRLESFYYQGKKYRNLNNEELLKYKKLYEQSLQRLKLKKKEEKSFGFLYIRRKVINLDFKAKIISSFKDIRMDYPEDGDFQIEKFKKNKEINQNLSVQNLINNFNIEGIKKNPYLWAKLPFTLKDLIQKHYFKNNLDYFFNYLKIVSLKDKQIKKLIKIIKNRDFKKLQKYFHIYYHKIIIIRYIEEKYKEKIKELKIQIENSIELEKAFYEPFFLTESFNDVSLLPSHRLNNISIEEKRKKNLFKLDYIPKVKKLKVKYPYSKIKVRSHLMQILIRKERMLNRKINFIDKKDIRNSSMNLKRKFKPVKFIKKVYDDITGKIIQYNLQQPSERKNNIEKKNSIEEIKAIQILNENKKMKMERVLKLNQINHFFKHWKFIVKEKNKKPKFFEIIKIMMKCLFTNNIYIKAAFMEEIFFIKGRYLFFWAWKTIGERIRQQKKMKNLKKKSSKLVNL